MSVDDFLAECDDVIADWEGSTDSATWAADGSHEHDTGGEFYALDDIRVGGRRGHSVDYVIFDESWEMPRGPWVDELWANLNRDLERQVDRVWDRIMRESLASWHLETAHGESIRAVFDTAPLLQWGEPPVTDDTRALLAASVIDPMRPPAYLWRYTEG